MTINDVIDNAARYRPNHVATEEQIVSWLAKLDGLVKIDIMDAFHGSPKYNAYKDDTPRDTELLIKAPHDEIYNHYVFAQIDLLQDDKERADNEKLLFQNAYDDYHGWYVRNHIPKYQRVRYW